MPKGTVNTELVKQAYSKIPYDSEMLKEFQACCDPNDGPMHFMKKFVRIQHPTRGGIDFEPFDYQEDLIVNVGDRVFFNYDSSDLDSDAQELLQDQVAWLKQYSDVSVIVEGHCDERGTREYNLALGEKRAQSVKNYLISLGISSDRISTISYGKERPAVVGSNDGAWAQNRRSVTIVN